MPLAQVSSLPREFELFCPVCHKHECPNHLVEIWQETLRTDHLAKVVSQFIEKPEGEYNRLKAQYPTPESCFDGTILMSWEKEPPPGNMPLFKGELQRGSSRPQRWFALFHQKGPELLREYEEFIRGHVNKPKQIKRILQVIRKHEKPRGRDSRLGDHFSESDNSRQLELFPTSPQVAKSRPKRRLAQENNPKLTEKSKPVLARRHHMENVAKVKQDFSYVGKECLSLGDMVHIDDFMDEMIQNFI